MALTWLLLLWVRVWVGGGLVCATVIAFEVAQLDFFHGRVAGHAFVDVVFVVCRQAAYSSVSVHGFVCFA